jgi:6-phosphogluconolactonase
VVVRGSSFAETGARILRDALEAGGTGPGMAGATPSGPTDIMLAGGSTPEPIYRELASEAPELLREARFFFGDERAVPPGDPRRNATMAHRTLLDPAGVPASRVHAMEAHRDDLEAAAREYAAALPARLDLILLGIGDDGHTASLFPGDPAVEEAVRAVVAVEAAPADPPRRLTITPPVLARAALTVVLARGEEKAPAVRRALQGTWAPRDCPAQLARAGIWILDTAAAGRLDPTAPPFAVAGGSR